MDYAPNNRHYLGQNINGTCSIINVNNDATPTEVYQGGCEAAMNIRTSNNFYCQPIAQTPQGYDYLCYRP